MDGVHLDAQVHWRAGANTYARRADLVLPFLLETGETSEARHGAAAATPTTARGETAGNNVSESKASKEVSVGDCCPWCGVSTLRAEHANDTVEDSDAVNVAEVIVRGRDGERHEGSGLDPASATTNVPQNMQGCVEGERLPGRSACVSCGFEFPSADLWSVSESRAARSFVNWQGVCSAGGHWRDSFCTGAGVRDTVGIGQIEMNQSNSFRKACLRGRVERENMRRRHRREERDVATGADFNEVGPRTVKGGGDITSRLAPMASSKRRQEVELELGEHHAEEQRRQAARQLCSHSGRVDHWDVDASDRACVVLDLGSMEPGGNQYNHSYVDTDAFQISPPCQASSSRGHTRAVRTIQRLWHRRQEWAAQLAGSSPSVRQDAGTTWPANEQAVTKLQSAFRGFHVRRALQVKDWSMMFSSCRPVSRGYSIESSGSSTERSIRHLRPRDGQQDCSHASASHNRRLANRENSQPWKDWTFCNPLVVQHARD